MTQQKYSVGNEVLIRAKVVEFDESDTDDPYLIQMELDGYRESGWFSENQIYSIAPEFNPGEEIEVTDEDSTTWSKDIFVGYLANRVFPYICIKYHWKYARKIKPQVIDKEEDITVIRNGKKYKLVEIE